MAPISNCKRTVAARVITVQLDADIFYLGRQYLQLVIQLITLNWTFVRGHSTFYLFFFIIFLAKQESHGFKRRVLGIGSFEVFG